MNWSIRAAAAVGAGMLAGGLLLAGPAAAHHNQPDADSQTGDCGETTIATAWPLEEHQVANTALVVLIDGEVSSAPIGEPITVGPFEADTTIQWRIWGGGERDYDSPPLDDLEALLEYLDDNPGGELDADAPVAWHELKVYGCPTDPEPEPTTEPTVEPTVEPTEPAGEAGEDGPGEQLAQTGLDTRGLALIGLALTILGGVGVWLARRKPVLS
jgi:LPXTG-motif cell wall-anchored protein